MCANGVYKSHWEPLAEVHFDFTSQEIHDDTYTYCLCSRVLISNISEEQSDDNNSETYQEETPPTIKSSELKPLDEDNEQFEGYENFNQFWMVNGENLISKSWYNKYSDFIDNNYENKLDEKLQNDVFKVKHDSYTDKDDVEQELKDITYNDYFDNVNNSPDKNIELLLDLPLITRTNLISPASATGSESSPVDRSNDPVPSGLKRERKFSYDSKTRKNYVNTKKNDAFKRRSDSDLTDNYEKFKMRELTVKILPADGRSIDSMTNITRLSMSSFLSTDLEEAKVSPKSDVCITPVFQADEYNYEDYWKTIWEEHIFEIYEQYYAMFINWFGQQKIAVNNCKSNASEVTNISNDLKAEGIRFKENECLNKIETNNVKDCSNNKYKKRFVADSVGMLLKSLLIKAEKETTIGNGQIDEDSGDVSMNNYDVPPEDTGEENQTNNENRPIENNASVSCIPNCKEYRTSGNSLNNSSDEDEKRPERNKTIAIRGSHEAEYDSIKTRVKKVFRDIGLKFEETSIKHTRDKNINGDLVMVEDVHKDTLSDKVNDDEFDSCSLKPAEGADFPAEVVWRKRRIKKIPTPKRNHEYNQSQKNTHIYFGNSDDIDQDQVKSNGDNVSMDCDDNELSSECDHPTIVESARKEGNQPSEMVTEVREVFNEDSPPKKSKKKLRHRKLPPEVEDDQKLLKYWKKRWSLFSLFDRGIRLDSESWFSVTPEAIAAHTASRLANHIVVDGFCGAGGNTIQLALTCDLVLACDIDPHKIDLAQHNASVYGVRDRIQFIVGDFFQLAPKLRADAVFLSPPWGGPQYKKNNTYDVETMLQPAPASRLMVAARHISEEIAIFLPRNSDSKQLVQLAGEGNSVEIEQNYLGQRLVGLTAYYGDLVCDTSQNY